ncbi:hypothetical protein BaRGS_00016623 [Batillaria attramentaria]|uniref:Uncharacterized protein n=1 Tax=Batillaria attramentaria TaxID=370345 RepID=A0ABD0KY60_9CAEN
MVQVTNQMFHTLADDTCRLVSVSFALKSICSYWLFALQVQLCTLGDIQTETMIVFRQLGCGRLALLYGKQICVCVVGTGGQRGDTRSPPCVALTFPVKPNSPNKHYTATS